MHNRAVAHPKERHGSHDARMSVDDLLPVVNELVQCRKHEQSADMNVITSIRHRALSSLRQTKLAQCLQAGPCFDTMCCTHMQNTVEATVTLS